MSSLTHSEAENLTYSFFIKANKSFDVGAEYIHYGILAPFELGHKFCWQILYLVYLLLFAEWQEGVQKADQSCGMIAEYLLEREVCLRIQVLHNHLF